MWAEAGFHTRVLIEVTLLSGVSAFLGPHVLDRRLAFFTHTLGHATFPGIALAAALGANLMLGGFAAGVVAVAVLALLTRRAPRRVPAVTGLLLAGGFALGMALTSAFLDNTARNLETFLVGQIVNVTPTDLAIALGLLAATAVGTTLWHGRLVSSAFDPEGYRAAGHAPAATAAAVMVLVAAAAAAMASQVGSVLAVAFLVAAPSAARALVRGRAAAIAVGWALGEGAGLLGATVSAHVNVATGPTITLALGALTALAVAVAAARGRSALS